jgi:hypothetical protein
LYRKTNGMEENKERMIKKRKGKTEQEREGNNK